MVELVVQGQADHLDGEHHVRRLFFQQDNRSLGVGHAGQLNLNRRVQRSALNVVQEVCSQLVLVRSFLHSSEVHADPCVLILNPGIELALFPEALLVLFQRPNIVAGLNPLSRSN